MMLYSSHLLTRNKIFLYVILIKSYVLFLIIMKNVAPSRAILPFWFDKKLLCRLCILKEKIYPFGSEIFYNSLLT